MSGSDGKRLSAGTGNAVPNRSGFLFPAVGNPDPGRREAESRPAGDHSGGCLMSGGVRFNVSGWPPFGLLSDRADGFKTESRSSDGL